MGLTTKADHSFGELKKTLFTEGETPYMVWRETQEPVPPSQPEVDVLEHLRFNIDQLADLNSRFQFLLEELSSVLVKKKK
jgi:hypothetical protein